MCEQSVNYMTVKVGDIINYICGFPLSHDATVPDGSSPLLC